MKKVYQLLLSNANTDYVLACIALHQVNVRLKTLCVLEFPNEELLEAAIHQTVDARVEIRGTVRLVKFVQRELGVRLDSDALIRLDSGALICIPQ